MKPHRFAALLLLACTTTGLHAEPSLPADDNKEEWNRLVDLFAECSAVYNHAATLKEMPAKGTATYRELANHALIAGLFSAQRLGLSDSYLESVYTVKFARWEKSTLDKTQANDVLLKADQCMADSLALQVQLVETLRDQTSAK